MKYPSICINRQKLIHNAKQILELCRRNNIEAHIVTKSFCAYPPIVEALAEAGVRNFADSRTQNLKRLQKHGQSRMMLRLPMISEAAEVVRLSDISLNSEYATLRALSAAAVRQQKQHGVILMVELGDLREGVLPEDLPALAEKTLKLPGLRLMGVGVNMNCYGGVIPDEDSMGKLVSAARAIEEGCGVRLPVVSGGNSGALYLLNESRLPKEINHLRIGEALLLGRETSFGRELPNMYNDVFTLRAQIVECREKPSLPFGKIGLNAFGETPVFEDKGIMKRAIAACGHQDTLCSGLASRMKGVYFIGASSDHMIFDVTASKNEVAVGSVLDFSLSYGALLAAFTSGYIHKVMI